jgi:GT2 family glycosyltransferase
LRSDISISIVHYGRAFDNLDKTLHSLSCSLTQAGSLNSYKLFLVDNGPADCRERLEGLLRDNGLEGETLSGHGNIGYGAGHNLAFPGSGESAYHLVMNPDIEMPLEAIENALAFMRGHHECGLLTPAFTDQRGDTLYLCKRYPSVVILALRGLGYSFLGEKLMHKFESYEMRDVIRDRIVWDPCIASGCFMFFRSEVFEKIGGFDSRYFMYFEDFDISLRLPRVSRIAFVPWVAVTHLGGMAARKGLRHIWMFCRSGCRFFNTYGWKFI